MTVGSYLVGRSIGLGLPINNLFPQIRELRYLKSTVWKHVQPIYDRRRALATTSSSNILENDKSTATATTTATTIKESLGKYDDLLSTMIDADMSVSDICDHMSTLTSAGHDTTTYFMAYLVSNSILIMTFLYIYL